MAIYITGDCHGDFTKFSTKRFPQQKELTKDDYVIVCGDFGIWHDNAQERYWLDWLSKKNFTILFVDGNHENHDRFKSNEFQTVPFCGGRVQKIRENIYHLMRGYVFELCGKCFFAFGGAKSHDIQDGILDINDYENISSYRKVYKKWIKENREFRVNHVSWWKEELPSEHEMCRGMENLSKIKYHVDYVITHCLPQHVINSLDNNNLDSDILTMYFERLLQKGLSFKGWYAGHYHRDIKLLDGYEVLYSRILRIL